MAVFFAILEVTVATPMCDAAFPVEGVPLRSVLV